MLLNFCPVWLNNFEFLLKNPKIVLFEEEKVISQGNLPISRPALLNNCVTMATPLVMDLSSVTPRGLPLSE